MKIITFIIVSVFSSLAIAVGEYDGSKNYVIGYLPKFSQSELDDPNSGAGSAIDHVEWAVFETVSCLKKGNVVATPKEIYGNKISIIRDGKKKTHLLPSGKNKEIGLILLKAGSEPLFLPAQAGPSSLIFIGPQEASVLFKVKECERNA